MMNLTKTIGIILTLTILNFGWIVQNTSNQLCGTWEISSIKWIYPDTTYHLQNPQPGFLQFSKKRYSFIWTPSENTRTPFVKLAHPTAEEMQNGFKSVVFNAGTYTIENDKIIVTAEIAKVPGFEGGIQIFEYQLDGDHLTYVMVDETYPSGEKPAWYGKLKTEFKLIKIDDCNN